MSILDGRLKDVWKYGDQSANSMGSDLPGYGTPGFQQAWEKYLELQKQSKVYDPSVATRELGQYADIFKQHFKDYAGRDPNADEYSRFWSEVVAPQGSYPGGSGVGIPELINRTDSLIRNNLAGSIDQEKKAATDKKAQGLTGEANDLFQSVLGRPATKDEADHYAKLMASGDYDQYTMRQVLQQLPEYQDAQNTKNRENLRGELSKADQSYFQQNVIPTIQSNFAQSGRMVNSDSAALAAAFANAASQQNTTREQYLAQLGASDYANTRQNALNQYLANQQRSWQQADTSQARNYQLADTAYGRANDITDYMRQQSAYQDYLSRMGRRKSTNGMGGGIGTLVGTGVGALLAAPTGGMSIPMGAMLGGSLGGAGGSLFDRY